MALTIKQAQQAKCPAAEVQQPVLSPHPIDIECRVAGMLQPLGAKPCNGCYADCNTWVQHKKQMEANRAQAVARAFQGRRATSHTLSSEERESIRG